MSDSLEQLSHLSRVSIQKNDWITVAVYSQKLRKLYPTEAEGYFLTGLVKKVARQNLLAMEYFSKAIELDKKRYDAAIELSNQYLQVLRHGDAFRLIVAYKYQLTNSPHYLYLAAKICTSLGVHDKAWKLYEKACQLQPELDVFQADLAKSSVLLGKTEKAKAIYLNLISKYPTFQKNHFELSKIEKVVDTKHIDEMKSILNFSKLPTEKNIYLYYAIAKELEDLAQWSEAFEYYKIAGDAVLKTTHYNVDKEIEVIDTIIEQCNVNWLSGDNRNVIEDKKSPIFIVGLPRTGTTLVERMISSHSQVESADETFFIQQAIRHASGEGGIGDVTPSIIKLAVASKVNIIGDQYLKSIEYRLGSQKLFIDKYPFNYLYLGFIAKAFPTAKIIYLQRNPMDACFAMFKQSFFKFSYSLDDLGKYYVAQNRLHCHWQSCFGDRFISVNYEGLVAEPENEIKKILGYIGLKYEKKCLNFELNPSFSATASTLQVREKIHTRSLNKWKNFTKELEPLRKYLEGAGIKNVQVKIDGD